MADKSEEPKAAAKGGKKKLFIIVGALLVVALVGGGAFFMLKGGGKDAEAKPGASPSPTYVAGAVVTIDPITINLASGHFLKLGLALQATADAGEEVSGAKAQDAAIALFSGKPMDELADAKGREHAKNELVEQLGELYEHKVYDVYFTQFVMQ